MLDTPDTGLSFDHIPSLRELIPDTGGTPGYEYAQVALANAKRAQDAGLDPPWRPVPGAQFYTITGPKGSIDLMLLRRGSPIRGLSPQSGARQCYIDKAVYSQTGLGQPEETPNAQEPPAPRQRAKGQGVKDDVRVQGGEAA